MGGGLLTAVSDHRETYFTFTYPGEVFQVPRFFPVTLGLLKLGRFAHFSVRPLGREGQLSIGHSHVCHFDTFGPILSGPSTSPLSRDNQLSHSVYTGGGTFHMPNPSKSPATEDGIDVVKAELRQKLFKGCFVLKFSSTHPPNHVNSYRPLPLEVYPRV